MIRARWLSALVVLAPLACGGATTSTNGPPDASPDQEQAACCPPDPSPSCCMHYGGWSGDNAPGCAAVCDGMPEPGDPAWHLVKDSHACDVWSSSGSTGPTCGSVVNDPSCPAMFESSLCGTPCTHPGLACSYPNGGDAMFCNADDGGASWSCGV